MSKSTVPTAAQERAKQSRSWLSKRHGRLLREWASLRGTAWSIDRSWSARDLIQKLHRLQSGTYWDVLQTDARTLRNLDLALCHQLGSRVERSPRTIAEEAADPLTIHEIERLLRIWFPDITRADVRKLLIRAKRRHVIAREKRGVYVARRFSSRGRQRDEEDYNDEWEKKFVRRMQRDACALIVHVLLPRVPVYRKALALRMSERSFHYAVGNTIEAVLGCLDDDKDAYRTALQRRLGY